jgi:hypothetical protein
MMEIPRLYDIPLWVNALAFLLLLSLAVEAGYRTGLRQRLANESAERTTRGDVTLSAMLALLGLMLAFTYAFTLSRADARKQAIVEEANTIGTAFLKADFLAEPGRGALRAGLLDYAGTRIITAEQVKDAASRRVTLARMAEAQSRLWPALEQALRGKPLGPYEASMMQAVTEVLDAQTRRNMAGFDRMPPVVTLLLLAIAALSLAVAGHNAGLRGGISRPRMAGFVLILSFLMLVILDFDRPQTGFIRLSNAPLSSAVEDMARVLQN